MPTDETATEPEVNAPSPDGESPKEETPPETPEPTDDDIKSHPLYQELEKKHSAARKGLDDKAKEVKRLKSALVDEEPETKEEAVEKSAGFTQDEKVLLKWEIKNQDKIDLCPEEYDTYTTQGVQPELALRLALDDKGITETNLPEHLRQISAGQPAATVNREPASTVTDKERQDMEFWGYSEETLKLQKQQKAEREKA